MRPASLVLLTIGVGLLLGAALVASFKIPCREMKIDYTVKNHGFSRFRCNVWGQPLWAVFTTSQSGADWLTEHGPYPNGVRQGKWKRITHETEGKPSATSDIWFLDDREVSAAEWEQRQ